MGEKSQEVDDRRWRADAAKVYRSLRDRGPARAVDLARECFPVPSEGPPTSIRALQKRGWRRVIDSIVWMRHQGVVLSAVPDPDGSVFHLGVIAGVRPIGSGVPLLDEVPVVVTRKVSRGDQPTKDETMGGEAMEIWHQ